MSGFRGRGGGGDRGGGRGGRGGFRGGRGGFGGGPREPEAPPATVVELGEFVHACEGEMVCKNINEKVRRGAGIFIKALAALEGLETPHWVCWPWESLCVYLCAPPPPPLEHTCLGEKQQWRGDPDRKHNWVNAVQLYALQSP